MCQYVANINAKQKLTLIRILHHKCDFYYKIHHQLLGDTPPPRVESEQV